MRRILHGIIAGSRRIAQAAAAIVTYPWDITTAYFHGENYSSNYGSPALENTVNGLQFSTDGTHLYVVGSDLDTIFQHDLSTPWDLKTAAYHGSSALALSDASPQTTIPNPHDLYIDSTGTRLYICESGFPSQIYQYTLGTAWDITTLTLVAAISVFTIDQYPLAMTFKPDGTKLYFAGSDHDIIRTYYLSTPWDITTAGFGSPDEQLSVLAYEGSLTGMRFKSDGSILFITGGFTDAITAYHLTTPWDISTASLGSPIELTSVLAQENVTSALDFKPDGTRAYIVGTTTNPGVIFQYDLDAQGPNWMAQYANYDGVTFNTGDSGVLYGLYIRPDGKRIYYSDASFDFIHQYDLGTAFDLSTVIGASPVPSFYVGSEDAANQGVNFSSDGTTMYVFGGTAIFQYALSIAWDVTTAHYDGSPANFYNPVEIGTIYHAAFKSDGTKMYLVSVPGAVTTIFQYTLSTPWDVTTASYDSVSSTAAEPQIASPADFWFSGDGKKILFYGSNGLYTYILDTAWDISTMRYSYSYYSTIGDGTFNAMTVSPDGSKVYTLSWAPGTIHQYTLL